MITKQLIEKLALERIEEKNLEVYIVAISISPAYHIMVELDCEKGGVSIVDCMAVSRNIEHNLDREEQDFGLEVGSADLTKPLRVFKQYIKNLGKMVEVKPLTNDNYKSGKVEGILKSATESEIVVTTKEKKKIEGRKKKEWVEEDHTFKLDEVKETKIIITF